MTRPLPPLSDAARELAVLHDLRREDRMTELLYIPPEPRVRHGRALVILAAIVLAIILATSGHRAACEVWVSPWEDPYVTDWQAAHCETLTYHAIPEDYNP